MTGVPLVSGEQAAGLNRLLTESQGLTHLEKIEQAGRALAELAARLLGGSAAGRHVVVLAGAGNKGAAGMAAARFLHEAGATVRLVLSTPRDRLHEMAAHQAALLARIGIEPWGLSLSEAEMAEVESVRWTETDLIVDALVGSGLVGDPRGDTADLIRLANASRRPILALDMPSGLWGDEGFILSPCIDAVATLALGLPRQALAEGWPVAGEVWLADVGVTGDLCDSLGIPEPGDLFESGPVRRLGAARALKRRGNEP